MRQNRSLLAIAFTTLGLVGILVVGVLTLWPVLAPGTGPAGPSTAAEDATSAAAQPQVQHAEGNAQPGSRDPEIQEWPVPWENTRPRDPYVGPEGRVWFVGQVGHYVASFDPESGEFRRYDLEDGTGPHNLIVDTDGTVWYAGNLANHIGRVDPSSGAIEKFMMPDDDARDPHTLAFDDRGHIWFTVQGGNFIGRLNKATGEVRLTEAPRAETPRGLTGSRPYGIKIDSQGRPWVVLFNTNVIVRVNPADMGLHVYELPDGARPRRLEIADDGGIWYVDYARGKLARLDPATGGVQEYDTPGGERSRPYGMAMDQLGRIWFVETGVQPNRFVGFRPDTHLFFSNTELESGGGTVRHMYFHEPTHSIWFGTDTNTIGRAVVPMEEHGER